MAAAAEAVPTGRAGQRSLSVNSYFVLSIQTDLPSRGTEQSQEYCKTCAGGLGQLVAAEKKKCRLNLPEKSTASSKAASPEVKVPCVFRGTKITGSWKLVTSPLLPISLQPGGCMLPDSGSSSVEACTPARKAGYRANHKLGDACAVCMLIS